MSEVTPPEENSEPSDTSEPVIAPATVLAIGAHTDDIEFGCGGTLLALAKQGVSMALMILTDGANGGDPKVRRAEQVRAGVRLGEPTLVFSGFPDGGLTDSALPVVETLVEAIQPALVFVNSPDDTHQDHMQVPLLLEAACRKRSTSILYYETISTRQFDPTVFADISAVMEKKIGLLQCHESQMSRDLVGRAKSLASYWGWRARVRRAEAFEPVRFLFQPNKGMLP